MGSIGLICIWMAFGFWSAQNARKPTPPPFLAHYKLPVFRVFIPLASLATEASVGASLSWACASLKASSSRPNMVLQNDIDLLNPLAELEKKKHKLKRLVQSPNSFFMDVKCQGCFNITTIFSHSQTVVVCSNCQTILSQPTGGKARLTEGCSFRRKAD